MNAKSACAGAAVEMKRITACVIITASETDWLAWSIGKSEIWSVLKRRYPLGIRKHAMTGPVHIVHKESPSIA